MPEPASQEELQRLNEEVALAENALKRAKIELEAARITHSPIQVGDLIHLWGDQGRVIGVRSSYSSGNQNLEFSYQYRLIRKNGTEGAVHETASYMNPTKIEK